MLDLGFSMIIMQSKLLYPTILTLQNRDVNTNTDITCLVSMSNLRFLTVYFGQNNESYMLYLYRFSVAEFFPESLHHWGLSINH